MGNASTPDSSPEPIQISAVDTPGVSLNEALTVRGHGPSSEAVRRITSDGWRADGDLANGRASSGTSGRPSYNEDLTQETVRMLMGHSRWADWDGAIENVVPGSGADCKVGKLNSPDTLLVEVLRAEPDRTYWKELSDSERTSVPERTLQEMADGLWGQIENNKGQRDNKGVVLAVNALRTPAFAFLQVVQAFRRTYGQPAASLGFLEVWICGPAEDMIFRLDEPGIG
jgi:hypothetical protein